jgi:hypothetical protein
MTQWGDPEITQCIYLGDTQVEVTVNLHAALRAVRKLRGRATNESSDSHVRLWVDALCINQSDNEERSHQVRQMRQIYSRSKEVLCWVTDSPLDQRMEELSPRLWELLTGSSRTVPADLALLCVSQLTKCI